jgi:hypothetical protein
VQIVLNALVVWLFVLPAVTFVHELGHALPARAFSRSPVIVLLGRKRPAYREDPSAHGIDLGVFRLIVKPFSGFAGYCYWSVDSITPRQHILTLAGGPIASALLALLLWQAAVHVDFGGAALLLQWAAVAALIQFLVTAIPIRYPRWWGGYDGMASDGYKILRLLRPLRP